MHRRTSVRRDGRLWLVIAGLTLLAGCADARGPAASPPGQVVAAPVDAPLDTELVVSAPPPPGAVHAVARRAMRRSPVRAPLPAGASNACRVGAGRDTDTDGFGSGTHVVPWGGVEREVIVRLPAAAPTTQAPSPVVFNLHPSSSSAVRHDAEYTLSSTAAERGYVVIVPEGVPPTEEGQLQVWEFLPDAEPDDLGYLSALVDWIGEATCVDLGRVYAAGFSNGATMAHLVACHSGGRFRAVAGVAAQRFPLTCPSGPISVLGIHGTDDRIVPYTGGPLIRRPDIEMPDVEATFEDWAHNGRCAPSTDESAAEDVRIRRWSECHGDVEVVLYTVLGGDHVWPRTEHPLWPSSIDATEIVLGFFDAH